MLFFIHILTDVERLTDHEGAEYLHLSDATLEAYAAIRSIIADELKANSDVPLHWRAQITDENGRVASTVSFASVLQAPSQKNSRPNLDRSADTIQRVRNAMTLARSAHTEIIARIEALRQLLKDLDTLDQRAKSVWKH